MATNQNVTLHITKNTSNMATMVVNACSASFAGIDHRTAAVAAPQRVKSENQKKYVKNVSEQSVKDVGLHKNPHPI